MSTNQVLAPSFAAMKQNLRPGLALQAFAIAIVATYYAWPEAQRTLDQLGVIKQRFGYLYSAVVTAFFGGLVPFLFLWFSGHVRKSQRLGEALFYVGFWFWKGAEVDALYRAQGELFGTTASFAVIWKKTLLDQLLYLPFWAVPCQVLLYLWKDAGFTLAETRRRLAERSFINRCVVVLFSSWLVWLPAVSIIYMLPSALQISIYNLVLCFWCLLMSHLSRNT
jgi:hypothetical protein